MADINHVDPDETIIPLEEDNDPPFSKPSAPNGDSTDLNHSDDDELDETEAYNEGLEEASDTDTSGDSIEGYDPNKDQRNL